MSELYNGVSDADLAAETRAINKIKSVPQPPIDGEKFRMCGIDVIVPPLKAKHLKKFAGEIVKMSKFTNETSLDVVLDTAIPIVTAALNRNYPSLTVEDVEELLDVAVLQDVLICVSSSAGFRKAQPGER